MSMTDLQRLGQDWDAGWRDIASAPKDGTEFLVWGVLECSPFSRPHTGCHDLYRACYYGDGILLCGPQVDGDTWVCGVDYWMPLPPPPVAAGLVPGEGK